jgi:tRNA pseudouridine32 synthase / 23S rRNA pseudouridine746 synthase
VPVTLFDWATMTNLMIATSPPAYWYEGYHPQSQQQLRLPRSQAAEAAAQDLMLQLANDCQFAREGKMYGVLLVETASGEHQVLKAFSGLLNGERTVAGWVPPIPGREQIILEETRTLAELDIIKHKLITLQAFPERSQYTKLSQAFAAQLQSLAAYHRDRKQQRQQQRQIIDKTLDAEERAIVGAQLEAESRKDGMERRDLKRQQEVALRPLKKQIEQIEAQIKDLKQRRKLLSRQLQTLLHDSYWLTNFAGESRPLQQLMPQNAIPTGTGDCCAPKLLHYAATQGLKPLAMAEFWWGPHSPNGDKIQGNFYGACAERCQPLMGFLLAGTTVPTAISPVLSLRQAESNLGQVNKRSASELSILYQDEWMIVVNKPTGLLSVPGRSRDRQDSVLSQLRCSLPDGMNLLPVHRLDQETSGILVLARNLEIYRSLSQQFQQRQVQKIYEAILAGTLLLPDQGVIDLPLWGNPANRPYQTVDWQRGKPSVTQYQVLSRAEHTTRIEFKPETGRSHQLRVHAVDPQGLGVRILGDRLYGCHAGVDRLYLHAKELCFWHPQLERSLHITTTIPF